MSSNANLNNALREEVDKLTRNMEELNTLRKISRDLRNYRRMITIRQND